MDRESSLRELRALADSALRSGRPGEAVPTLEEILAGGPTGVLFLDAWLKLVYCLCVDGRVEEAQALLDRWESQVERLSPRYFDVGHSMVGALVTGNPSDLRSASERFAQGYAEYPRTDYPGLFATIDRKSRTSNGSEGAEAADHDYRVSSYLLWIRGLKDMAEGSFRTALPILKRAMQRYELGHMTNDVLWTWSDGVLCQLCLDDDEGASELFTEYESLATTVDSRFLEVARCYLEAFDDRSTLPITTARHLIAHKWDGFKFSSYPAIFKRVAAKLRNGAPAAATAAEPPRIAPRAEAEKAREEPDYFALVARPAREADDEVRTLVDIAATVNMGATRAEPSQVRLMVQLCRDTLTGSIPWDQGLLYLATEYHGAPGEAPRLAGSSKLQFPLHDKWRVDKRKRVGQKKHVSECEMLVFDATPADALEMAGNAVLPEMRGVGVGSFHVAARLLFVSMFPLPITHLFANLLTTDIGGKYPFFEEVVSPLLGGMDYDQADQLRYEDTGLIAQLLGNTWDHQPPVQFPLHILPKRLRDRLGEVRHITRRAQTSIERYGFRPTDKLDLLDGGQYFELPIEALHRRPLFRELTPVPGEVRPGDRYLTFAPLNRSVERFCCVRCRARIDDLLLHIPLEVYKLLELRADSLVKVILKPESRA